MMNLLKTMIKGDLSALKYYIAPRQPGQIYELADKIYDARIQITMPLAFIAGFIAGVVYWHSGSPFILLWLVAMIITECFNLANVHKSKLRLHNSGQTNIRFDLQIFAGWEIINSAVWAIIGLEPLLLPLMLTDHTHQVSQYDVVVFGTSFMVIILKVVAISSLPDILLFSCLPLLLNIITIMLMDYDALYYPMTFALIFITVCIAYFIAVAMRKAVASKIFYDEEKKNLIEEVDSLDKASDLARLRAEQAEKAKSQFLSTMSHELRTPLNAIIGFSELMRLETFGPLNSLYQNYVNNIYTSGGQLLHLIDNLLDISRIEAGNYILQEEAVALYDVVLDCCNILSLDAYDKAIAIHTRRDGDMMAIWADKKAITQIVISLLTNAIKFSPQKGRVIIEVRNASEGGQLISVKDSGHGIPEPELDLIRQPFNQTRGQTSGVGIGLSIVDRLVKMHDGEMTIVSQTNPDRPNQGTKITVTFANTRVLRDNRQQKTNFYIMQKGRA